MMTPWPTMDSDAPCELGPDLVEDQPEALLVFQMSLWSFQPAPSDFQMTMYLPWSMVPPVSSANV